MAGAVPPVNIAIKNLLTLTGQGTDMAQNSTWSITACIALR
jgi:hypothetical protein